MRLSREPRNFSALIALSLANIPQSQHAALAKKLEAFKYSDYKIQDWEIQLLTGNPEYYTLHAETIRQGTFTPCFYALWSGNIELVQRILQQAACPLTQLSPEDMPIMYAAIFSQEISVLEWIKQHDNLLLKGNFFLENIAKIGWLEGLIWLVEQDQAILKNKKLFLNLHQSNIIPFFKLLKNKQYTTTKPMQDFIFHLIEKDNRVVMEEFLQEFPELANKRINNNMNILHVAAMIGSVEMIYLLATLRKDLLYEKDNEQRTFVDYACFSNHIIKINCALELFYPAAWVYEVTANWKTDNNRTNWTHDTYGNVPSIILRISHTFGNVNFNRAFSLKLFIRLIQSNWKIHNFNFPEGFQQALCKNDCEIIQKSLKTNRDFFKIRHVATLLLAAKQHNEYPFAAFPIEIIWAICCAIPLEPVKKPIPLSFFEQKRQNKQYDSIAPVDSCVIS